MFTTCECSGHELGGLDPARAPVCPRGTGRPQLSRHRPVVIGDPPVLHAPVVVQDRPRCPLVTVHGHADAARIDQAHTIRPRSLERQVRIAAGVIVLIGVVMTSVSLGWIPANRFIG